MNNTLKKCISILLTTTIILTFLFSFTGCKKIAYQLGFGENPDEATTTPARETVKVLIKPGLTALRIAETLEEKGVCSASAFLAECQKMPEGYDRLLEGVTVENKVFLLEGYLYPETYEFYKDDDPARVLKKLLTAMDKKMSEVIDKETYGYGDCSIYDRAAERGMTMDQVIILASVIQAEANLKSNSEGLREMRKVSSVFTNRLAHPEKGFGYIGSDVTRQYIDVKLADYIKENNLDKDALFAAYNTNNGYDLKVRGLPKGPVSNPTRAAIIAALWPEDTDYYYFFTDKDGKFHYYYDYKTFTKEYKYYYGK